MAHPDVQLPVDTSVKLPQSVIDAAKRAEAHYVPAQVPAQVQVDPAAPAQVPPANPDQPVNIVAVPASTAPAEPRPLLTEPVADQAPVQVPVPSTAEIQTVDYASEYYSMRGRWAQSQQTVGMLQEQIAEQGRQLQDVLRQVNEGHQQQRTEPVRKLTADDEKTYGPEFLDVARRAAQDAMGPEIQELRRSQQQVAEREQRLASQLVLSELDEKLPNWRTINTSPEFLAWLRLPDVYSGSVRGNLLRQAVAAASASRVLAFFKGYIAEAQATGQLPAQQTTAAAPAPARQAAVPLETLTAPGRIQPAPAHQQGSASDTPWITRKQIAEFYSHAGAQRYVGREKDREHDQQIIFDAQRLGRIR